LKASGPKYGKDVRAVLSRQNTCCLKQRASLHRKGIGKGAENWNKGNFLKKATAEKMRGMFPWNKNSKNNRQERDKNKFFFRSVKWF